MVADRLSFNHLQSISIGYVHITEEMERWRKGILGGSDIIKD
jgi:hypothetical protein